VNQDGSLAGAGSGNHQHRAMNVLDRFSLAIVREELERL
jgi:hypothetical protein